MPYNFNKDEERDPNSLTVQDWRFLRRFNACFFVLWIAFFTVVVVSDFQSSKSWLRTIPGVAMGFAGATMTGTNIIRSTLWLRRRKAIDGKVSEANKD
jgi:hypothetical protein